MPEWAERKHSKGQTNGIHRVSRMPVYSIKMNRSMYGEEPTQLTSAQSLFICALWRGLQDRFFVMLPIGSAVMLHFGLPNELLSREG